MKNSLRTVDGYILKENCKTFSSERESFLSHISHGIRTPLNSIMGFSKLLVVKDLVNDKQKEYIKGILSGSNLLLEFVDNIIDLAQFEAENYSLRIKKFDINQIMWEFTEGFYNRKIENNDTNINLMLVWDKNVKGLEVETDSQLIKKSIQRIINLIFEKYPTVEYELGYRLEDEDSLTIFVRPALSKLTNGDCTQQAQNYDESDNSFDYFNYQVLSKSLKMLGGELFLDSDNQEYSFNIPLNYR